MYFVWAFILEISEGEVADKGMLGLKRDWSQLSYKREGIGYVLQPVKERLVCIICLVRYIYHHREPMDDIKSRFGYLDPP